MRLHDDTLPDVLSWSFEKELVVDIYHGSDLVASGAQFVDWSMRGDLDQSVKITGSGTIVYASVNGESILPVGVRGAASPFRARLLLSMNITAGRYRRKVQLGWFRVTGSPNSNDVVAKVNGRETVTASVVSVQFASLDEDVRVDGFTFPTQPLLSGWAELRAIGVLPVRQTRPDFNLPKGFTWEPRANARLDAMHTIAAAAGCVPVVNSQGMWELVPDGPEGSPALTLRLGEHGTVTDIGTRVSTEGVANHVVGIFEDSRGNPIYADAPIQDGPLSVDGPWGRHTVYIEDPTVTTRAAADLRVSRELALRAGSQLYDVPITCVVNPLLELGDMAEVTGWTRELFGQIVQFELGPSEVMQATLRVRVAL